MLELWAEPASSFTDTDTVLLEKETGRRNYGFSDLVSDRYSLQDQWNELVISRVTTDLLPTIKHKLLRESENLGKHVSATMSVAASLFTNFSAERGGDMTEWDTFMLHNEMDQHLEDLHTSVKHYFPMTNLWCYKIIQGQKKKKIHSKCTIDEWVFVGLKNFIDRVSNSTYPGTFKKLVEFGCGIKEKYPQLFEKDIKFFLPFPAVSLCKARISSPAVTHLLTKSLHFLVKKKYSSITLKYVIYVNMCLLLL